MTKQPYVYVKLFVMLGDCDGSIKGTKIFPTKEWKKEINALKNHLKNIGKDSIEIYDNDLNGSLGLDSYTVFPCSQQDLETLKKFQLDNDYGFRNPTDFIP